MAIITGGGGSDGEDDFKTPAEQVEEAAETAEEIERGEKKITEEGDIVETDGGSASSDITGSTSGAGIGSGSSPSGGSSSSGGGGITSSSSGSFWSRFEPAPGWEPDIDSERVDAVRKAEQEAEQAADKPEEPSTPSTTEQIEDVKQVSQGASVEEVTEEEPSLSKPSEKEKPSETGDDEGTITTTIDPKSSDRQLGIPKEELPKEEPADKKTFVETDEGEVKEVTDSEKPFSGVEAGAEAEKQAADKPGRKTGTVGGAPKNKDPSKINMPGEEEKPGGGKQSPEVSTELSTAEITKMKPFSEVKDRPREEQFSVFYERYQQGTITREGYQRLNELSKSELPSYEQYQRAKTIEEEIGETIKVVDTDEGQKIKPLYGETYSSALGEIFDMSYSEWRERKALKTLKEKGKVRETEKGLSPTFTGEYTPEVGRVFGIDQEEWEKRKSVLEAKKEDLVGTRTIDLSGTREVQKALNQVAPPSISEDQGYTSEISFLVPEKPIGEMSPEEFKTVQPIFDLKKSEYLKRWDVLHPDQGKIMQAGEATPASVVQQTRYGELEEQYEKGTFSGRVSGIVESTANVLETVEEKDISVISQLAGGLKYGTETYGYGAAGLLTAPEGLVEAGAAGISLIPGVNVSYRTPDIGEAAVRDFVGSETERTEFMEEYYAKHPGMLPGAIVGEAVGLELLGKGASKATGKISQSYTSTVSRGLTKPVVKRARTIPGTDVRLPKSVFGTTEEVVSKLDEGDEVVRPPLVERPASYSEEGGRLSKLRSPLETEFENPATRWAAKRHLPKATDPVVTKSDEVLKFTDEFTGATKTKISRPWGETYRVLPGEAEELAKMSPEVRAAAKAEEGKLFFGVEETAEDVLGRIRLYAGAGATDETVDIPKSLDEIYYSKSVRPGVSKVGGLGEGGRLLPSGGVSETRQALEATEELSGTARPFLTPGSFGEDLGRALALSAYSGSKIGRTALERVNRDYKRRQVPLPGQEVREDERLKPVATPEMVISQKRDLGIDEDLALRSLLSAKARAGLEEVARTDLEEETDQIQTQKQVTTAATPGGVKPIAPILPVKFPSKKKSKNPLKKLLGGWIGEIRLYPGAKDKKKKSKQGNLTDLNFLNLDIL